MNEIGSYDLHSLEVSNSAFAAPGFQHVTIHTKNLRGRGDLSVYAASATAHDAPIILLLHGVRGSHWAWSLSGGAHESLNLLRRNEGLADFVLVMPSDGLVDIGSCYLDGPKGAFETWIMSDVLSAVHSVSPQVSEASNLYLCGLSMGGYGALRLGAKHAGKVRGISAHSAVTDISDFALFMDTDPLDFLSGPTRDADIIYWLEQNKDTLPPIRLDCGTQDRLISSNRLFHTTLDARGIAHAYEEFQGGHNWTYWRENFYRSLRFFDNLEKDLGE